MHKSKIPVKPYVEDRTLGRKEIKRNKRKSLETKTNTARQVRFISPLLNIPTCNFSPFTPSNSLSQSRNSPTLIWVTSIVSILNKHSMHSQKMQEVLKKIIGCITAHIVTMWPPLDHDRCTTQARVTNSNSNKSCILKPKNWSNNIFILHCI